MSVEENNRAIAKFMGVKHYPWGYRHENKPEKTYRSDDELKYDSSWSCLMPVVEKIAKINGCHVLLNPSELAQKTAWVTIEGKNRIGKKLFSHHGNILIDVTYKAVVEFIKWYNEQQKT